MCREIATAIYSEFKGAEYRNIQGLGEAWTLPCTTEVNITLRLGGQNYSVHPLDANLDVGLTIGGKNGTTCVGSVSPTTRCFCLGYDVDQRRS